MNAKKAADQMLESLYAEVPDVACKGLCVESCGSVGLTPLEQRRIAEHGVHLPLMAVFGEHCPALKNGRCSAYPVRPMVCRLWGAVEGIKCEYGCAPVGGHLPDREGRRLLARSVVISRRAERGQR